jgi:SPP1 family phage portal protein
MNIIREEFSGRLTVEQIVSLVDAYSAQQRKARELKRYYEGDDPGIMDRKIPDEAAPNNKAPIPYGRKIINTVVGYMYKPGLVKYASKQQAYLDVLNEVFRENKEPIKTARLGKDCSLYGVAYEYHYADGVVTADANLPVKAVPRFAPLPVGEVIPIYDYAIEPKLTAFIRFYERVDETHYFVYYEREWIHYKKTKTAKELAIVEQGVHQYGRVPLNVYTNNDERIGDFEPVCPLIDAYDVLMSDSLNEFDRFAWAYLVLKGFKLSRDEAADIKNKRAFDGLDDEDAVKFLTKDINADYIQFLAEWARKEIHNQSGIPDISDISFGASASGTTIDKFIYLMELFTDPKEALFKDGLIERIKMIDGFLKVREGKAAPGWQDVDISMIRNLPIDDVKNADALGKYSGHVTERTLLTQFAPFVTDVDKELEELKKEKDESLERIQKEFDAQGGNEDKDDSDGLNADS